MTLLRADQAADRLGVKVETIYAYVSRGALQPRRRPGSRASWFDPADVEALARRGRPRRTTRPPAIDFTVQSAITAIEGHTIRFRGHDAARLATTATFEQVAELLWTGELPAAAAWPVVAGGGGMGLGPVDALRLAVVQGAAADPLAGDLRAAAVVERSRQLLSAMVAALPAPADARAPRLALGGTPLRATVAGRLWARLAPGRRPAPPMVLALNAALVLLADHELAASTVAARVAASTRADPYCVVLAGLGAVGGPLHGRASRRARALLDTAARHGVAVALAEGPVAFGHPLYPDGDPRAPVLLDLVRRGAPEHPVLAVADEVAATVRRRAGLEPNVDFGLAVLTAAAGMGVDAGEVVFSLARAAGWIAHALEEYEEQPLRFRARAVYVRRD